MGYSIYISTCSILLLSRSLSEPLKQSVQDSILFSQLCADEDFCESPATVEWQDVFKESLGSCGWSLHEQQEMSLPADSVRFNLINRLLCIFGKHLSGAQNDCLDIASKKLSALPESTPLAGIFRDHAVMKEQAHIKMQLGIVDEEGLLTIATVLFKTVEDVGPNLIDHVFDPARVQGHMKTGFINARLNIKSYEENAENIVQWLGSQRQSHSGRID
ncbi:hypothetical protein [Pseudomonas sp. Irchel s3b2]|uniref:hypothetical protein n=1 Tax=Pseudomonas sp. Irchel s3b2 TaxID=2009073 RepID=UPI000BA403C7|nr:hypothetical protein [Pseudomonas sp. Irchel s3b2]